MRSFIFGIKIITLIFLYSNVSNAEDINKTCISQTGKSKFSININTDNLRGVMDYEFMGQYVTYEIINGKINKDTFSGIAKFLSSKSGEIKDESFIVSYDIKNSILKETNLTYKCK